MDVFGTVSNDSGGGGTTPPPPIPPQNPPQVNPNTQVFLDQGYIPIASWEDFRAINSGNNHDFAQGTNFTLTTEGGLHKKYVVVKNIDLSGYIGITSLVTGTFAGTFEGNGYTLSNLSINAPIIQQEGNVKALFRQLGGATIQNITLQAFNITGHANLGTLVGSISSGNNIISNIHVFNSQIYGGSTGTGYVGGLVGSIGATITMTSISVNATVTSLGDSVGGVIGAMDNANKGVLDNIYSYANVHGKLWVGGIIGYNKFSNLTLSAIYNYGKITADLNDVGGIIGFVESGTVSINLAYNYGEITGENSNAGILGRNAGTVIITSAFNYGSINGQTHVGGIIGFVSAKSDVMSSFNYGQVIGNGNDVGGLVGEVENAPLTILDSGNIGIVRNASTDNSHPVGGIIGRVRNNNNSSTVELNRVYNAGLVTTAATSPTHLGSIIGLEDGTNTINFPSVFYLSGTVQKAIGSGTPDSGTATGISAASMVSIQTFVDAGWNISLNNTTTWSIGYQGQLTYPWLSTAVTPTSLLIPENQGTLLDQLNIIPLASLNDILAINSTSNHTFASGTAFELETAGGYDKTYIVVNDIDLSTTSAFTTSLVNGTFSGIIRGEGFTLSNLSIDNSSLDEIALIRLISGATIENLNLTNFNITVNDYVGALASTLSGTSNNLSNIHLNQSQIRGNEFVGGLIGHVTGASLLLENFTHNSVVIGEDSYVGGIIGYISDESLVTLSSVLNNGTVSGIGSNSDEVGGIVGEIDNSTVILENVTNNANVSGDDRIGGIFGSISGSSLVTLTSTINNGTVIGIGTESFRVGGIVGTISNSNVLFGNVSNFATVSANFIRIGGIIGFIFESSVTLTSITNSGDVTGDDEVGGIVGEIEDSTVILENVTNNANVSGYDDRIGGIIGRVDSNSNVTLSSVTNSGDITSIANEGDEVAGIIGRIQGSTVHMTDSINHGTIKGKSEVGGLVGDITGGSHVNIIRSMNYGSVTSLDDSGSNSQVGGLVGDGSDSSNDYLRIFQSANFGTVSGHLQGIGGLIGEINRGSVEIIESFNEGEVHLAILTPNQGIAGGIVGFIFDDDSNVTLSSVYNSGLISASSVNTEDTVIGGLIGRVGNDPEVSIIHAYNVGNLTSSAISNEIGNVMGSTNSDNIALTSVFYLDSIASGISFGAITGTVNGSLTPVSIAQMTAISTFSNASWDISTNPADDDTWTIQYNGQTTYPWLTWAEEASSEIVVTVVPVLSGDDLKTIEDNLFGTFELQNDINLASFTNLTRSFIDATFTGNLSGQGFTIRNLTINGAIEKNPEGVDIGLFSRLANVNIDNISLSAFNITGTFGVGGLAGSVLGNQVNNFVNVNIHQSFIYASAIGQAGLTRTDHSDVGGLFGSVSNTIFNISNSHSSANVKNAASRNYIGGFVGLLQNTQADLNNLTFSGIISGGIRMGGIIGTLSNSNTVITFSSIHVIGADISGSNDVGGLVGYIFSYPKIFGSDINIQSNITGSNNGSIIGTVRESISNWPTNNGKIDINFNTQGTVPTRSIGSDGSYLTSTGEIKINP
jgi:hypothetical protein